MTQAEVQQLGVQGQFELVGERVERMYELLTEAQLQISDGLWKRGYHGLLPHAQPNEWSTPGMTDENSYNVATFSALFPEGATGDPADLEPMIGFFKEKGWPIETTRHGTEIQGLTHDGFVVSWRVQANGQYNMKVESQTFWGDVAQLRREIGLRVPPRSLDMSDTAPGEYVPDFPSWDDPAIYEVDLLNHWRIYEEEAAEAEQFRDSEESVEAEGESTLAPGDPAPTP